MVNNLTPIIIIPWKSRGKGILLAEFENIKIGLLNKTNCIDDDETHTFKHLEILS
jgi:hypothetical protein